MHVTLIRAEATAAEQLIALDHFTPKIESIRQFKINDLVYGFECEEKLKLFPTYPQKSINQGEILNGSQWEIQKLF